MPQVGTFPFPYTMAGCPASEAWGGGKWALRRHEGRGQNLQAAHGKEGSRGKGEMMLHAEPAILGDVQLGRESLSTRSQQGPSQGSRGQARARVS